MDFNPELDGMDFNPELHPMAFNASDAMAERAYAAVAAAFAARNDDPGLPGLAEKARQLRAEGLDGALAIRPSSPPSPPRRRTVPSDAAIWAMMRRAAHVATARGDVVVLRSLLARAPPAGRLVGPEAIWLGVMYNRAASVEVLLRWSTEGADLFDAPRALDGGTPLHFACMLGHTEVVRVLLRVGAGLDTRMSLEGGYGETPL